ncbi:hypothetical protein OCH239_10785 [Roseivivax halodurans JCM 10272]|uniref:Uncharacterized protein n=1 Tax=Roseivivax halodurans JCM 10272 TaxID=1449350 RepID=X7EBT5_9RHOB|nr:hypothetical protein [Roseivivax halodurans]ETX13320.1 hypothetical protein OCH239_10785 [Roseivivax halodurans JCM 10272]
MDTYLTRSRVSALSKLMADPGVSKLSHLQRIDGIAKVLGFENQAALMATLKAAEEPAAPSAAPSEKPFRTVVAFGRDYTSAFSQGAPIGPDDFGGISIKFFGSEEAMQAYFQGIEDGEGWDRIMGVEVACPDNTARAGSLLSALEMDPDLDAVAWHNARMAERVEELGEESGADLAI